MSVYTAQRLIESFPAYNVFEREVSPMSGVVEITANDKLGFRSPKGFYRTYSVGSAASYAIEYNECPIEAYNNAVARGHETHWINARGSCITAERRHAEDLVNVTLGMKVKFEGRMFTIEQDFNNNLKFVPA